MKFMCKDKRDDKPVQSCSDKEQYRMKKDDDSYSGTISVRGEKAKYSQSRKYG